MVKPAHPINPLRARREYLERERRRYVRSAPVAHAASRADDGPKSFMYPGAYFNRQNVSVFEDGDGSWPVMTPVTHPGVTVTFTVLRTEDVERRLAEEEE